MVDILLSGSSLGIFLLHSFRFCVLKKEDCADGKHWNCMDALLGCPRMRSVGTDDCDVKCQHGSTGIVI